MDDKIITIDLVQKVAINNDYESLKESRKISPLVDSLSKIVGRITKPEYIKKLFSNVSLDVTDFSSMVRISIATTYCLYNYLKSKRSLCDSDTVTFEEVCSYLEIDLLNEVNK